MDDAIEALPRLACARRPISPTMPPIICGQRCTTAARGRGPWRGRRGRHVGLTEAEVFAAIAAGPPQAIQLPVSALDQRMLTGGALAACAAAGITVFARSVFLQGAILMAPDRLPAALRSCARR